MFELPDTYNCLVPTTSQTQIYAYTSRSRDTYDLVGFDWVLTRHVSYNYDQDLSQYNCLDTTHVVPASIKVEFVLPAMLFVLYFFYVVYGVIMGRTRG